MSNKEEMYVSKEKEEINEEEFEEECMALIESIASEKKNRTVKHAFRTATAYLNEAKTRGDKELIKICKRVCEEFSLATQAEYAVLRKLILDAKK